MTRLTTKGQVVIPKAMRGKLGWRPGTRLRGESDGERVTLHPVRGSSVAAWLAEITGSLTTGDPVSDLEAEHRAEVERDARRRT
jgi:AbrB family looped-hinge helix DNA binding protein